MTAPIGNPGPNRDLYEQRIRGLARDVEALRQRGGGEPILPIAMYPKFAPPAGVYLRMSTATDVSEQTLWEGRVGRLTHSRFQVDGVWGPVTGTNTTRYRLKINGVTVGTWDVSALENGVVHGPYASTGVAVLGAENLPITVTAQTISGSGTYACQILGCHQRQP